MEKKRAKNVRGSPQSWGYIHQKVSHACDLHFIKWLQSATINVAIPFYRTLAEYSLGSNFSNIHSIQNILQCTWDVRHDSCIFPLEQYLFPETIVWKWKQDRPIHQFLVYTTSDARKVSDLFILLNPKPESSSICLLLLLLLLLILSRVMVV